MICVTGAGGTVGSEVVRHLQSAGVPFRAAYFSAEKADAARAKGIDSVVINYNRPETMRAAFQGCDKLFLLAPNVLDQARLELNAVEAAKAAGVRHIVKLSVWQADREEFEIARSHRMVEKAIESSGLAWTFLRPNSFMQNIGNYMAETVRTQGAFYSAAEKGKIGHVDVRDIAAVAVKALTEPGHEGKTYSLTGPEALSYDELAGELSKVLSRRVSHVNLPPADLKQGMLAHGMPEGLVERLLDLDRYYREDRANSTTDDIKRVTGREPRPFAEYARESAPLLRSD